MKKVIFTCLMVCYLCLSISAVSAQALPLFTVKQNSLSEEMMAQIQAQIEKTEISDLLLTKNKKDKDIYPVVFSAEENTKIIILNEQTGNYVELTPVPKSLTEFQLSPFFIEELKQGALGDAERYLIVETHYTASPPTDYLIKNVASVSTSNGAVFIPRYFYGEKENVQEALPKERQIVSISKTKPHLISAFPDDPEVQQHIAQLEEERSYYVYIFKLPDGTKCSYDENFNPDNSNPDNSDAAPAPVPIQNIEPNKKNLR